MRRQGLYIPCHSAFPKPKFEVEVRDFSSRTQFSEKIKSISRRLADVFWNVLHKPYTVQPVRWPLLLPAAFFLLQEPPNLLLLQGSAFSGPSQHQAANISLRDAHTSQHTALSLSCSRWRGTSLIVGCALQASLPSG